jgi:hypothetical protein
MICFCFPARIRAELDAEIAARDHHGIGEHENLVERLQRGGLLDLRQHARAARRHLADIRDIFGTLHEGETEPIDRQRQRIIEIGAILRRQRRDRQQRVGEVDALVVLDHPALDDFGGHPVGADLVGDESHLAVVDQQIAAGL